MALTFRKVFMGILLFCCVGWKNHPCPEGTTLVGEPPPRGSEQSCQKADGTRHGKSTLWHKNGNKYADGEYRDGKLHGVSVFWFANGQKEKIWEHFENRDF